MEELLRLRLRLQRSRGGVTTGREAGRLGPRGGQFETEKGGIAAVGSGWVLCAGGEEG